jgi:para-nitrobenzyl esterase
MISSLRFLAICLIVTIGIVSFKAVNNSFDNVAVSGGLISGTVNKDGDIQIFKGIPFAAPPVGNLRWQAPKPVAAWKGVRKCDAFSASPIQATPKPFMCWTEEFIAPPEPLSEDCLYLNIWSGAKSATEKRPVFVWIYGGGLTSGSAACAIYDGEEMAKEGCFLSINYRVGLLVLWRILN